jgi:hypothetical protein
MKRYLLFLVWESDSLGGWHDFKDSYESIEDAMKDAGRDYGHIVDTQTGTIVRNYDYDEWTFPDENPQA